MIRAHYFQGESFSDIAERLKLTKGRVSQIHSQALQLIREAHGGDGRWICWDGAVEQRRAQLFIACN